MASLFLQEGVLSLTVLGADSPASRCSSDHQPRHCPNKVGYALRTRCRSSSSSSRACSAAFPTPLLGAEAGTRPRRTSLLMRVSMRLIPWFRFQLGSVFLLLPSALPPLYPLYMHVKAVDRPVGVSGRPMDLISSYDLTLSSLSCLRHVRRHFAAARRVCLLHCSIVRLRVRSAKYSVHSTIGDEVIVGLGGGQ
jgi:hypothetical protein